jgi:hypothetical protein
LHQLDFSERQAGARSKIEKILGASWQKFTRSPILDALPPTPDGTLCLNIFHLSSAATKINDSACAYLQQYYAPRTAQKLIKPPCVLAIWYPGHRQIFVVPRLLPLFVNTSAIPLQPTKENEEMSDLPVSGAGDWNLVHTPA